MPPTLPHPDVQYTLAELVLAVASFCARLPAGGDERVREAPDERTIRYYQTYGLLDRPAAYRGRTAIYGYRHLLQAVAVKVLQGQGLSLAQAQKALMAAPTDMLERACQEALSLPSAAPAAPAPAAPAAPAPGLTPMPTYALAPGVWLTLDPSLVADPAAVAALLASALNPNRSNPR